MPVPVGRLRAPPRWPAAGFPPALRPTARPAPGTPDAVLPLLFLLAAKPPEAVLLIGVAYRALDQGTRGKAEFREIKRIDWKKKTWGAGQPQR